MMTILIALCLVLSLTVLVVLGLLLRALAQLRDLATAGHVAALERSFERTERSLRDELGRNREESARVVHRLREELGTVLRRLTESNDQRLEVMRTLLDERLRMVQDDNACKLEQIRQTVDEKLQGTLEKRLSESFSLVSERLEQVYKGLGEMQTLAAGVGDLKRVLTNVKTRGTWGEVQLAALLEQVLTVEQYACNVAIRPGSNERVEFAIRLPGRDEADANATVWLPVDAKFPQEDYLRLVDAADRGDADAVEHAGRQLELRVRGFAKDICEKYVYPPATTDFAMMFLPTEGLYAEVLRRPGLVDDLQREFRVCVAGPSTLHALLNSLQMGFRTLAIRKRSSEVWAVLGAVKTELGKFGGVLEKVQKKLQEASSTIEAAATRTRVIERTLRKVEVSSAPIDHEATLAGAALLGEMQVPACSAARAVATEEAAATAP